MNAVWLNDHLLVAREAVVGLEMEQRGRTADVPWTATAYVFALLNGGHRKLVWTADERYEQGSGEDAVAVNIVKAEAEVARLSELLWPSEAHPARCSMMESSTTAAMENRRPLQCLNLEGHDGKHRWR
jgi:hypothetical protein